MRQNGDMTKSGMSFFFRNWAASDLKQLWCVHHCHSKNCHKVKKINWILTYAPKWRHDKIRHVFFLSELGSFRSETTLVCSSLSFEKLPQGEENQLDSNICAKMET